MTRTEAQRRSILREVNVRIRTITASFGVVPGSYSLLCECGRPGCVERVEVPVDAYAFDESYVVSSGHERLAERIVARGMTFTVVESALA